MCMPMGAVTAFKGLEKSMVILHGSQGCSTYIRRHMAEHYNEPVDIASSSLNEEGTVFGGEKNLKMGLENIIKLYNPSVIGVCTTCLAETIGEDIERIIDEFREENMIQDTMIIPVHTPGYGGSQSEGYHSALRSILEAVAKESSPNGRINIIPSGIGPGDVRNISRLAGRFGISIIMFPDISETLDAPYSDKFNNMPDGGCSLSDIRRMPGSLATIEMGMTVSDELSPGKFLEERFGVPLYRCVVPIGLKNSDRFVDLLSTISGKPVPTELTKERGRLLDGMIDSHKYNAEGRATIFGEPELILAVSGLCIENGIEPVLLSTGTVNSRLAEIVEEQLMQLALPDAVKPVVLDDSDFETINELAEKLGANILIGNSDGKVVTEKLGIPLVRIGYPIHDRVGGQRQEYTLYNGTLRLLDEITNTLLEEKYKHYRQKAFERYYGEPAGASSESAETDAATETELAAAAVTEAAALPEVPAVATSVTDASLMSQKTLKHPCFSGGACKNARMHLPVAPACNISCNYCTRKYDCVNESRPGVTSSVLSPVEAAAKFLEVREKVGNLTVVGIAGPGDALAEFEKTSASIKLIKELSPDITFCISTNGLLLPKYADEIVALGITHVTVTINAIDPEIGAKIYREINYEGKKYSGAEGAAILIRNQLEGLALLASKGIVCKVNTVLLKGINDEHVGEVVRKARECGAYISNIMPLIPASGSVFEHMPLTDNKELNAIRKKCGVDLLQMYHCRQCRADAIGTLDNDRSAEFMESTVEPAVVPTVETAAQGHSEESMTLAVASSNGRTVDTHFGHAREFLIYKYDGKNIIPAGKRSVEKYCGGPDECDGEVNKTERAVQALNGCNAVLVMRIGYSPMKALESEGIKVIQSCDRIEEAISMAMANR